MNQQWQSYLRQAGAVIVNDAVSHFGDEIGERRATTNQDVVCDLSHFGLIRVEGEDAAGFLQGQFSNDVKALGASTSQLNSYNSPKGRMLACFRLFLRDNAYYLRLPRDILEPTLKRLRMFVLRSKVTLNDASNELVAIGLAGPQAEQQLKAAIGVFPETNDAVCQMEELSVIRVPGLHPRFEVFAPVGAMIALWEKLAARARPVGAGPWAWLDIQAGIPNIHTATVEAFVPQMVNLHAINGVSFTKGCYPGQEVVARMHYLGKLKRRMYRIHVDASQTPAPGDNVYESGGEQSVGKIVEAQHSLDGGFDALAVIQIASTTARLHLDDPNGPQLTLGELPYKVSGEA